MDNKIFNVNGIGKEMLLMTISLALNNHGFDFENKRPLAKAWKVHPQKGFILMWGIGSNDKSATQFPVPFADKMTTDVVWDWLQTDEAKNIPLDGWDANAEHDGSNSLGWRVYCEDWGKVDGEDYAIVAIKPAYMWYGK